MQLQILIKWFIYCYFILSFMHTTASYELRHTLLLSGINKGCISVGRVSETRLRDTQCAERGGGDTEGVKRKRRKAKPKGVKRRGRGKYGYDSESERRLSHVCVYTAVQHDLMCALCTLCTVSKPVAGLC